MIHRTAGGDHALTHSHTLTHWLTLTATLEAVGPASNATSNRKRHRATVDLTTSSMELPASRGLFLERRRRRKGFELSTIEFGMAHSNEPSTTDSRP